MLKKTFSLISRMPLRAHYFFADYLLYPIVYHVVRYRRKLVMKNLRNAFPEKSETERKEIERKFYHHLCDVVVEMIYGYEAPKEDITNRVQFDHPELPNQMTQKYGGYIGALAHFGNWEWIDEISNKVDPCIEMCAVYRTLKNKAMDEFFQDLRKRRNATLAEKNQLLRVMVKHRAEKIPTIYGMIADQKPSPNNAHFWTMFLNQETSFLDGSELLARKFNYPICYVRIDCPSRGHYSVQLIELGYPPYDEVPMYELTKRYAKLLEEDIRRRPELWLWSHNRWKWSRPKDMPLS